MVKRQRRQSEGLAGVPDSLARSKKPRGNAAIDHATAKARPSHLVLSAYFSTLVTLRQYFITRLSGLQRTAAQDRGLDELRSDRTRRASEPLCKLLDTALVGLSNGIPQADPVAQDILEATACSPTWSSGEVSSQTEIVELAIRLLFSRSKAHGPLNVLTGGFSRRAGEIVSNFPNSHVNTLKTSVVWKQLLKIVRQEVMLDLLLNTSVFISVENDCYYQLIGTPISEFIPTGPSTTPTHCKSLDGLNLTAGVKRPAPCQADFSKAPAAKRPKQKCSDIHTPSKVDFIRSRMFFSRPVFNKRGAVTFGFRHNHVLNRYPHGDSKEEILYVMLHIFPRQFGLHNVFTCSPSKDGQGPSKDYTVRDEEIEALRRKNKGRLPSVPKRLCNVKNLVAKLQKLHSACSYYSLLEYYCPVSDNRFKLPVQVESRDSSPRWITQVQKPCASAQPLPQENASMSMIVSREPSTSNTYKIPPMKESFTDYASSIGQVSAFIEGVIKRVIPMDFFGGVENHRVLMKSIDRFLRLRRFESLSLHDIMQGLKIKEFTWLIPHGMNTSVKISQSDKDKRTELLAEFLYWLFEHFIIPLAAAHFYVTDSSQNSKKLYYIRHDVWRKWSEKTLKKTKLGLFDEMDKEKAQQILASRSLGYCQVRLLPKETGIRMIMNMKKRLTLGSSRYQGVIQAKSINMTLKPVFSALKYEKSRNPECLGSSMLSVTEIYPKLKAFKELIQRKQWQDRKLYFVKVDIQACFDSIPQKKLLRIINDIMTEDNYRIEYHAEIKPRDREQGPMAVKCENKPARVYRKFQEKALPADKYIPFEDFAQEKSKNGKRHLVYVDKGRRACYSRNELFNLLKEHIQRNMVKIGQKFYRQKKGIPQGSVLSNILCGMFYGDLEQEMLPFCTDEDGLLLRLVDDFLFITLNRENATKFLNIMYNGLPEYGARIGLEKCLVNFETSVKGNKINRLEGTLEFPYVGNTIHTKTLELKKDVSRRMDLNLQDTLTVPVSRDVGRKLHEKTVKSLKMNADAMFLDLDYNSTNTVLTNVYRNFSETAMKLYRHSKSLPPWKQPREPFLIKIVSDILDFAFKMIKDKQKIAGNVYSPIKENHIKWLGASAFSMVFKRKQAKYHGLLRWLDETIEKHPGNDMCARVAAEENLILASRLY